MQTTTVSRVYREIDIAAIINGAQVLLDDGIYRVLCLNNASASAWWGRETRWCTTSPMQFEGYRTYGELIYVEHRSSGRLWLLYVPTCEFRNARNRRANGQVFARVHPAVVKVIRSRVDADFRVCLFFGLVPDGARVDHSLDLRHIPILHLPAHLTVRDDLDLRATGLSKLPEGLKVGGDLLLSATITSAMPSDLQVGGRILRRDCH